MDTGGVSNSKSRSRRLTYQRVVVVGFAGKVPVKVEGVRWRFDFESNEDDAWRMFRRVWRGFERLWEVCEDVYWEIGARYWGFEKVLELVT